MLPLLSSLFPACEGGLRSGASSWCNSSGCSSRAESLHPSWVLGGVGGAVRSRRPRVGSPPSPKARLAASCYGAGVKCACPEDR